MKNSGLLFYLVLLTGFFLLLEFSFFIQCNQTYLYEFNFVTNHIPIPLSFLPGLIYFICAQCALHLSFCVMTWIAAMLITSLFPLTDNQQLIIGIGLWFIGILTALVANQYYFPNSKFAELTSLILVNKTVTLTALSSLLGVMAIVLAWVLIGIAALILRHLALTSVVLLMTTSLAGIFLLSHPSTPPIQYVNHDRPNIILIGVDSLRPDYLSFFGRPQKTPFFDAFLSQATVFSNVLTPLARTFPSWTSILTGRYPLEVGARSNLTKQQNLNLGDTVPSILQQSGYETIFATDETRFSNIDKNYGFDQIVTPPIGLNDFLLGTFNDFPLSNLVINSRLGQLLFPYSYSNRPVYFTYDPNSFIELLAPVVRAGQSKPLFLAVHFCLPHHPYLWANLSGFDFTPLERYQASIQRVDQQVGDFMRLLKKNHKLENAIVVLLSDHGEALELPGDRVTDAALFQHAIAKKEIPRFYPPSLDKEDVNQSAGHGTDVLGLTQYHTLLAIKTYGRGWKQQPAIIPGLASLLDVKPTLLAMIKAHSKETSGLSLASYLQDPGKKNIKERHLFLESDFSPAAIRTVYPETHQVLLEGIQLFEIDPVTTRLSVKDKMNAMIINSKQYADVYKNWVLAIYPQNNQYRMPILINLKSGKWTNDLQSVFAKRSPVTQMLQALHAFYGDELGRIATAPSVKHLTSTRTE